VSVMIREAPNDFGAARRPAEPADRHALRTPKAAAVAGILFSVLLLIIFTLLWLAIPEEPFEPGLLAASRKDQVRTALYLVPFTGIAFLWFIGVLRDRLGSLEDRFFATVFLGGSLLFLAMLFMLAAIAEGLLVAVASAPQQASATFEFGRAAAHVIVSVYLVKTAAVFMFTASTLVLHAALAPRWIPFLGFGLALLLLFGSHYASWSFVVFPIWVMLLSGSIFKDVFGPMPRIGSSDA
jgi:hypothetical protein